MRNRIALCLLLVLALGLGACSPDPTDIDRRTVYVSIPPLGYLADRVAGGELEVRVLLEPGHSPATFDPSAKTVAELSHAQVLFTIGVPFDRRLATKFGSALGDLKIVDCRKGIELQPIQAHSHGDHEHTAGEPDPHVWLSPRLAGMIASNIAATLSELDSAHASDYAERLVQLRRELDSTDAHIRELLAPFAGERMYVFHPAFGYFARAYGLEQVAIETEGKQPSIRELTAAVESARGDSVRALFVQPQFSADEVQTIAERIDASVTTLDPLAYNYLDNLTTMAKAVASALNGEGE